MSQGHNMYYIISKNSGYVKFYLKLIEISHIYIKPNLFYLH